jgi:leucyl aminopeptidase
MSRSDVRITTRSLESVVSGSSSEPVRTVALAVRVRRNSTTVAAPDAAFVTLRGVDLDRRLARAKRPAAAGTCTTIQLEGPDDQVQTVLALGVGDADATAYRRAGAVLARQTSGQPRVVTTLARGIAPDRVRAFVEGWALASYRFTRRSDAKEPTPTRLDLVVEASARSTTRTAVDRAIATADAVHFARDLANTPSNEKSPQWMADRAAAVAEAGGLEARTWNESDLVADGFGGVLAVGQGSARPPAVVELTYKPAGRAEHARHIVLVGKGITFDSGGLSLKPADFMTAMKTDMAGAAAVLAVMGALASFAVPVKVTALIALAENMPSGSSFRPGDVVTHYGGRTSEILNTDAEGRIVLADLLAYADAHLDPDVVVDIATLTGAASVGLGRHHGALYASDDRLRRSLLAAAAASGEQLWPMPLVEEYRSALDSSIADLAHVSAPKVQGGSITAALFLREFVGERTWAHLDIAGPGRSDADRHEISRGGTGFGTRVLLRWLEQQ